MNREKEIEKIKSCIADLVYDKVALKKAYNYYHCVRDAEQFQHIEDNYGIGVPTSVSFTPLVKKHIDVLVGEYLELDPELTVSCKDDETISNIMRDKQLQIDKECFDYFSNVLKNQLISILINKQDATDDPLIEKELEKIKKKIDKTFISEYELAAQFMLNYFKNNRDIDLKNKMREILTDLLIGGICYYRTKPTSGNNDVRIEVLNPIDTFIERNPNEFYLNKSPRAVVRRYLTKDQILLEFGDELSNEAKSKLNDKEHIHENDHGAIYVHSINNNIYHDANSTNDMGLVTVREPSPGILGGMEVTPLHPFDDFYGTCHRPLIPIYECEWLEYEDKKMIRHSGVKIGEEIFITRGADENIIRSVSNPNDCTLTVNGIFFNDKNGNPFSLMINTMDLQD